MYDRWHGDGWGGGHWLALIVMMVVFWGVVAVIALALVRSGGWSRHSHEAPGPGTAGQAAMPSQEAERILHERFARGEIDEEEYVRRHDLLKERSR